MSYSISERHGALIPVSDHRRMFQSSAALRFANASTSRIITSSGIHAPIIKGEWVHNLRRWLLSACWQTCWCRLSTDGAHECKKSFLIAMTKHLSLLWCAILLIRRQHANWSNGKHNCRSILVHSPSTHQTTKSSLNVPYDLPTLLRTNKINATR